MKTVSINCHRQLGVNMQMFLQSVGFKTYWDNIDQDNDKLNVFVEDEDDLYFLSIVKEESDEVHVPYHISLKPKTKGKRYKGDTCEFEGEIKDIKTFFNVSGGFRLVLIEGAGCNWIWKVYDSSKIVNIGDVHKVNGRVVCQLQGLKGENLILINWVRLSGVDNE